ncbi:MAG: hypothetical protein KJ072_15735 [Verrucomicrobia bacterium]|nr:hypothetical protein [Verrucomicrobiota bacterium]
MATIAPGRLHDVSNAADFVALTQTNFEILTAEVFKHVPTYVSGVLTSTIGPPTTGSHVLDETWKDALGGVFKCTAAGTPGTWKQILPAGVTADPVTGTIPTGYLILNVIQGTLKRHAGSYDWQTVIGATGGKIGFYGVTPVTQPAGADQAAVALGNTNGEIGGLTISDPPNQAEVQALRDKCEELADDVRALATLVHALRAALVSVGQIRGSS